MNRFNPLGLLLLVAFLSGCGLWSSEEEIEPAELESIVSEYQFKKLWSTQVGSGLGEKYHQLQPALLSSRIFAVDHEGTVVAVERDSGKLVWKQELELPISGGVGIGNGRVLVSAYDGQLVALSALDGSEAWRAQLNSEATAPVQVSAGLALVQTIDGQVTAFDSQSGALRWSYSAQEPLLTLRGDSAPLLTANRAYVGFSSGKLAALDLATGELVWESLVTLPEGRTELERIVDIDGSLLRDQGLIFAGSYQGRISAISESEGRRLWSSPLSTFRSLAQNGLNLFAVDAEGTVVAFSKRNGDELWKQEALYFRQVSSPTILDGLVAVGDYEGYIHLLDPIDGRFVGRHRADSSALLSPPLGVEGVLYTLSDDGTLSALQLQKN
ncbi:outer membrane protein assembly factor BamB [Motiliproteus coralliicola]|uniref:Outer membrane protein assembly factor BamB n=1 Tax=Motiliproteus coralliicola TaxID=2283196 RepID=A0A369WR34_9GAMM|nr:outer membrane protein assembly factor BamB [Motiliproteus coralliicola]RDE23016.1 outer membrane protein assembly factor BamB [Motiliproteus coralliicola]